MMDIFFKPELCNKQSHAFFAHAVKNLTYVYSKHKNIAGVQEHEMVFSEKI